MAESTTEVAHDAVAVIGTGVIGAGMAVNLLRNGHEVVVWNRTAERASDSSRPGRRLRATPAGRRPMPTSCSRRPPTTTRPVRYGSVTTGSSPVRRRRSTLVSSATLSPDWVAELADACRATGRTFLDMPVTGGRAGAEGGALMLLAGGEASALWPRSLTSSPRSRRPFGTSARWATGHGSSSCSTPCRRSTSSASARRWRWLAAVGLDPNDVGPALVERLGGPVTTMAWAADQQLPARANFALAWRSRIFVTPQRWPATSRLRCSTSPVERLSAAAAKGWGESRLDSRQRPTTDPGAE